MHRSEKHQIYTAGLILSACVLFAVAGWITYQVGTVYETMPTPADLIIQNFFFSLRGPVQNVIVCALTHLSDTMTIRAVLPDSAALAESKNLRLAGLTGLSWRCGSL